MNVETNHTPFYSFPQKLPATTSEVNILTSKKTGLRNNSKLIGCVALGALALLTIVGGGLATKILWQDHVNNKFPEDFSNDIRVGQPQPKSSLDFEPFAGMTIEDGPDLEEGHIKIKNATKLHHFSTASTAPPELNLILTRKPLGLQLETPTELFASSNSDMESQSDEPESKFSLIKNVISSFSSLENAMDIFPEGLLNFCTELALSKLIYNEISPRNYFDTNFDTNNGLSKSLLGAFTELYDTIRAVRNKDKVSSFMKRSSAAIMLGLNFKIQTTNTDLISQISISSLQLIAQAFHYGLALEKSGRYFAMSRFSLIDVGKHAFIGMISGYGMLSTLIKGNDLYQGAQLFSNLDDVQQKAVLKHRAIHHLATEKNCNTVIIDGMSSEWGKDVDDTPFPIARLLYNKCRTLSFRVTSSQNLCQVLQQATDYFGSPIDILSLQGHAEGWFMELNRSPLYWFKAIDSELKCMHTSMKSDGEILLLGCNSATRDITFSPDKPSLTEHVAEKLPTRKVIGIKAYLNPVIALQSFSGNSLSFRSYWPPNSNDEWVFGNRAVTYQNGIELT